MLRLQRYEENLEYANKSVILSEIVGNYRRDPKLSAEASQITAKRKQMPDRIGRNRQKTIVTSDSALLCKEIKFVVISRTPTQQVVPPRNYVRTIVQTTIFLAQNYACASTDDIFLLKTLQI